MVTEVARDTFVSVWNYFQKSMDGAGIRKKLKGGVQNELNNKQQRV